MRNFAKLFIVKAKDKDISSLYSNHIQNSYKIIYDMMYDIVKLSPAISKTWAELTIFSANPPSHPQKYEKNHNSANTFKTKLFIFISKTQK